MLKKLKFKVVILSGATLLILLMVVVIMANILAYRHFTRDADEILTFAEASGTLLTNALGRPNPPKIPFPEDNTFEPRYVQVLIGGDGAIVSTDTTNLPTVSVSRIQEIALAVKDADRGGFKETYRYSVKRDNGYTLVTLLECGQMFATFGVYIFTSSVIALAAFALALAVIIMLADRIIRPVSIAYEKQRRFITDAGHEIKTPLTVINANVDLMIMDEGENEALTEIKAQTDRLTRLTNDLITLAKTESAYGQVRVEFPLSEVVEEHIATFDAPARTKNITVVSRISPMIAIKGSVTEIEHLLSVLMDNALKYSPVGRTVYVTLKTVNKTVTLTIENSTAKRIPKEDLEKLFDRFYRGDPSRSSDTKGYGIGLSIAEAITNSHGGKISAGYGKNGLFRITVSLPMQ